MASLGRFFRLALGAGALLLLIALAAPVLAQQPVNPTASSVKEDQLLNELNRISGRCTLPDQKACTIEQPAGRDWRHFHQVTLRWIGAISILGMLVLLVAFYLTRGMVRLEAGRSGRVLVRFSAFERLVHWMTAACFIILAITGLNITFGKPLLLPLIGPEAFTTWSQWAKYAHNYLSFAFTIGVFMIFLMWIAWNIPNRVDIDWLNEGGKVFATHYHYYWFEHGPADFMGVATWGNAGFLDPAIGAGNYNINSTFAGGMSLPSAPILSVISSSAETKILYVATPSACTTSRDAPFGISLGTKPPLAPTGTMTAFLTCCAFTSPRISVRKSCGRSDQRMPPRATLPKRMCTPSTRGE